jgi:hypothetical protein
MLEAIYATGKAAEGRRTPGRWRIGGGALKFAKHPGTRQSSGALELAQRFAGMR